MLQREFKISCLTNLSDALKSRIKKELTQSMESRRTESRNDFEVWYSEVKSQLDVPPEMCGNHDPEFIAAITAAMKKLLWISWEAREPELALAQLQHTASTELLERYEAAKKEIELLRAENKQLRWTVSNVLNGKP